MRDKCVEMRDNANKMRDRLVEIIKASLMRHIDKSCKLAENIADDLLANGVVVLTFCGGDKEKSYLSGWIPCDLVDHPEHCRGCEVTRKDTIGYVRDIAFYTDKWRREVDEIPVDVIAWKEPSRPYMARREEAGRALKECEPICDYTKTDWNDCCECSSKDYCDKYNERSEIIGDLLGEIKNEGR